MPAENSGKRTNYSLTFKLTVAKSAKSSSNAVAARTHEVDESMVRRWRRTEAGLLAQEKGEAYRAGKVAWRWWILEVCRVGNRSLRMDCW